MFIFEFAVYAKTTTGVREQLPCTLKHGGNTRPWISLFRRADSIEKSYDALIDVLKGRNKLQLIVAVETDLNSNFRDFMYSVKIIFEKLEGVRIPLLRMLSRHITYLSRSVASCPMMLM